MIGANSQAHGDLSNLLEEFAQPPMSDAATSTASKRHPFLASFANGQRRTKAGSNEKIFKIFLSMISSSQAGTDHWPA
ncbi:hypothetical protein [Caballeronia zhejiangensis]|uniref:hypothetical protein n=1 Tax=Caballeronia zhejiangensis TaxID=871203 RepID=UPI00055170D1|nr:hypothetical protein [Caballeronia zhejiangensis]